MNTDLRGEDILSQVKEKLNKAKIKLWLDPYYDSSVGVGDDQEHALKLLCLEITKQLNINQETCLAALRDLQNHALDRLKSNEVFKETGVACLKVKVSGETPRILTISIPLTATTLELLQEISGEVGLPAERIKLISHGRVLNTTEPLGTQGVKNAMQLMAVILADEENMKESDKRLKTLETTKKDVKLLAGRSNVNDEFYFQVENQSGEAINLPFHEQKALVTAMALHEKGRAALKREDYSLALVLFLEADKEYSACTSQLLSSCDNYALLHLDIAWCYLCLRNAAQIPDADRRLRLCEENFHKTYGPNLERLLAIKGTTGNEQVLFMRLHLLQGVVLFHQNNRARAKELLERAQVELSSLRVDDNSLCLLIELGFSSYEARLGLRATRGNVEAAEELIHRKRSERELARERNRLQMINEREKIKLGLCADGKQYCEPSFVKKLVGMGFKHRQSVEALKLSNNSISEAINIIQNQPHLLPCSSNSASEESIAQMASLGFDPEVARKALEKCPGLEKQVKSLNDLATNPGAGTSTDAIIKAVSTTALKYINDTNNKRKIKTEEEKQAFERVSEDLIDSDLVEDHLDLNLAQEEQFLIEYMSLLN